MKDILDRKAHGGTYDLAGGHHRRWTLWLVRCCLSAGSARRDTRLWPAHGVLAAPHAGRHVATLALGSVAHCRPHSHVHARCFPGSMCSLGARADTLAGLTSLRAVVSAPAG